MALLLCCCLAVYYRCYPRPAAGYPFVPTAPAVRSTLRYWWWIPGIEIWICWMGCLALLRWWVARKNFLAKSPADPRNPQMMRIYKKSSQVSGLRNRVAMRVAQRGRYTNLNCRFGA